MMMFSPLSPRLCVPQSASFWASSFRVASFWAAVLALVLSAGVPGSPLAASAHAQTATNLTCKGCVGKKDIGKNAISKKNIRKGAIRKKHLGKNAVRSTAIRNGTVSARDLAETAKPGGADSTEGPSYTALTLAHADVISTTLSAPAAGVAVVSATWYFSGTAGDTGRCYLNTTPDTTEGPFVFADADGGGSFREDAAITRLFEIGKGNTTFYLNCSDDGTDMGVVYPVVTALYFPNRY